MITSIYSNSTWHLKKKKMWKSYCISQMQQCVLLDELLLEQLMQEEFLEYAPTILTFWLQIQIQYDSSVCSFMLTNATPFPTSWNLLEVNCWAICIMRTLTTWVPNIWTLTWLSWHLYKVYTSNLMIGFKHSLQWKLHQSSFEYSSSFELKICHSSRQKFKRQIYQNFKIKTQRITHIIHKII